MDQLLLLLPVYMSVVEEESVIMTELFRYSIVNGVGNVVNRWCLK